MNNAITGFTLQKLICDKYGIIPNSDHAINQFKAAYDDTLKNELNVIIDKIFTSLGEKPVECTTLSFDNKKKELPYNFILSKNSTLSIRTNISGYKVAPRKVGQAGFATLNEYFREIYGKEISNQDDIKDLIYNKIDKILPIFFDNLFDADYIVWIYSEGNEYKYHLINGNSEIDIDLERKKFSFTKNLENWIESTTLKYNDISIAEIQTHKNRSFKFRFIMKNILPFIISKSNTNESLGITAEKVVCDIFKLDYPPNFFKRYSVEMQYLLQDVILESFKYLPAPIKHSGSEVGIRGGASKSSFDFLLQGNKTLSLKTNIGKMVCPSEVGQPNDKTAYLYFSHLIKEDRIDKNIFKRMVYESINHLMKIYIEHLFDSDYLLRIYKNKNEDVALSGNIYDFQIVEKNTGYNFFWDKSKFQFSKPKIEDWNESNTVYYDKVSIGEFQVHNNRNCFKFRFNFDNLLKILRRK